jgi:hypothetical protein
MDKPVVAALDLPQAESAALELKVELADSCARKVPPPLLLRRCGSCLAC